MKFTKMQGAGNDFVIINCFEENVENPTELAMKLCDRNFGIGADGLVLIKPCENADFYMGFYNSDGSDGGTCGNALRCVAKYVYETGMTQKTGFDIETAVGLSNVELNISGEKVESVGVNMGRPEFRPEKIPANVQGDNVFDITFYVDGLEFNGVCLSMGNPHCVLFVEDVDGLDLEKIGPIFENNKLFPQRINTEFVENVDYQTVKMRGWERGAGETLACGSGACAVLVASAIKMRTPKEADVMMRGGMLHIKWDDEGYVHMTGPSEFVFRGEIGI